MLRMSGVCPKDTVISITISPKTRVLFSSLNIDESKYQKLRDPHKLNRIEYRNNEEEESISVVNDEISSFTYFAGAKDFDLRCSRSPTREPDGFCFPELGDLSGTGL